jgi:hypothetical protein
MGMNHHTKVGKIGNYYGSLNVKTEGDKCYWSIEDWDGSDWEEIPSALYRALLKFEKARRKEISVSPIGAAV